MKKTILPLFVFLITSTLTLAQVDPSDREKPKEKMRLVHAQTVTGNVNGFHTFQKDVKIAIDGKLKIEADSATFDRATETIVAYRMKKFEFDGEVVVGKNQKGTCRYKIGEGTLYLE